MGVVPTGKLIQLTDTALSIIKQAEETLAEKLGGWEKYHELFSLMRQITAVKGLALKPTLKQRQKAVERARELLKKAESFRL
mgnify:CR=1 FL=1